jgi:hypothetical protein
LPPDDRPKAEDSTMLNTTRLALLRALLPVVAVAASAAAQAQTAGPAGDARREAFRVCDAKSFLALNIARNYMMTDRNREAVIPHLQNDATAMSMAENVFHRVDAGQVRHPGEVAAVVLFECAAQQKMDVGAPRRQVALCFTRTDVAFFMHLERSNGVSRQSAVSKVQARLSSRELYPISLIFQVAEAVYAPPELPALRPLMGNIAWGCINRASPTTVAPSAASR